MRYAVCRTTGVPSAARTHLAAAAAGGADAPQWLGFGDRYFVFGPDAQSAQGPSGRLALAGARIEKDGRLEGADAHTLHLVTQKGRLFQQRYPDVRVLFDGGRYLVASISPHLAQTIGSPQAPCFKIAPITGSEQVFEVCPRPSPRPEPDPPVQRLVDRLSGLALKAHVTTLASHPTRNSLTSHFRDAAAWAARYLAAAGYETRLWPFDLPRSTAGPAGRSLNVVADKRGVGGGERSLVLVVAHLDSVNHDDAEKDGVLAAAPGADDNGSGSAGLLEMARVLAEVDTAHDLRLVLFGGEEQDLVGSDRYVERLAMADRARIAAVLNMDMIGVDNHAGEPPTVLLEGGPVSAPLMDELCACAHAYASLQVRRTLKPWGSDHVSFLKAGIPAVLTIEGYDRANGRVHGAGDTLDYLDYALALDILRMNTAFIARRAGLVTTSIA